MTQPIFNEKISYSSLNRFDLNPEQRPQGVLARAEHFAYSLRQSKRKAIHNQKRSQLKIFFEKKQSAHQNKQPDTEAVKPINPDDFMDIIESGVDFESSLKALALALNTETSMTAYLNNTPQRQINKLADWLVNFLPRLQNLSSKSDALTLLINLTCFSCNCCIFIANICHKAITNILDMFVDCPNEVCWLLNHILTEEKICSPNGHFEAQFLQCLNQACLRKGGFLINDQFATIIKVIRNLTSEIDKHSANFEIIKYECAIFCYQYQSGSMDDKMVLILAEASKKGLIDQMPFKIEDQLFKDGLLQAHIVTIMIQINLPIQKSCYLESFWQDCSNKNEKSDLLMCKLSSFCLKSDQILESKILAENLLRCFQRSSRNATSLQKQILQSAIEAIYNHCQASYEFKSKILLLPDVLKTIINCLQQQETYSCLSTKTFVQMLELAQISYSQIQEYKEEFQYQLKDQLKVCQSQLWNSLHDLQAEFDHGEIGAALDKIIDAINFIEKDELMDCD